MAEVQSAVQSSMTHKEMVRAALANCGQDAKNADLAAYVREKYLVELTPDRVSNVKSEINKERAFGQALGAGGATEPSPEELLKVKAVLASFGGGEGARAAQKFLAAVSQEFEGRDPHPAKLRRCVDFWVEAGV